MIEEFTIHTEGFEGPLRALLDLIEKHKLSINEVSLSQITDEYIQYIQTLSDISAEHLSSFVVVAATLMLIKSRSLLPELPVTEDEEKEMVGLEQRLITFALLQDTAISLKKIYGRDVLQKRPFVKIKIKRFVPDQKIEKNLLHSMILYTLEHIPKEELLPKTEIKKSIKIEEVLLSLMRRVEQHTKILFSDFTQEGKNLYTTAKEVKVFLVVSFLSVLELIKNGTVEAEQDSSFGEITITS